MKIGDATNSKALADRYAQIFSLSKDAMEHSIEAGYNVKTRDYVKKMIPEINVDQTIHFDKKIDSPKGNDMVVSSQSLDTFMHEFAGHSLLEKSKVQ